MHAAIAKEWDNITGIPHATPSDGDTTHFSLADEIYDWVIGLSYVANAWDADGDIDADEISESKIAFTTACASGSYYYLGSGDDLACKADPMDTTAEWASLCTNCVDNTDLGPDSVDLTSDALSSAYAGDGLTGGGTLALAFDCSDVTGSATDGIACATEDLTVAGGTCLTATTTGLGVTANCIGASQLAFDTNQHLNTTSSPTFSGLTVAANAISDEELDEGATFAWTGTHTFAASGTFNDDLIFADEIKPDNTLCDNSDLLFKTGADNWDCKSCAEITGSADLCDSGDADTTYTASGTLLDLTSEVFSINEGTLTDERICEYESTGTQLECVLVKDGSGECASGAVCLGDHLHSDTYFTETESNTNFVSRNAWTDIDNYPATCAAATPFIGTIGDTSTCRGVVSDTSPQLGGYLDTNAQNIGSTADEIENIYIATNSKIYLGNEQEGEAYYDGSKLIIKVN